MKTLFSSGVIKKHTLFFSLVAGLLLTASFPGISFFPAAWVALVPLLWGIKDEGSESVFIAGFTAGAVHNLTLLYWLVPTLRTYGYMPLVVSVALLILLCVYLSIYMGAFAWGLKAFCRRPLSLVVIGPALFVALDYLRSFLLTGFPWEFLGYSQHGNQPLIQMADITGVYGVSFLVVLVNVSLFIILLKATGNTWRGTRVKNTHLAASTIIAGGSVLVALFYGESRIDSLDKMIGQAPSISVSVVQGNINQAQKWDENYMFSSLTKYLRLSSGRETEKTDLIVWPETALPFYYPDTHRYSEMMEDGVREKGEWFLVGAPSYRQRLGDLKFYNSAFLLNTDGVPSDRYDKVHLVPFGEYVPLGRALSFLKKIVVGAGDFTPGKKGNLVSWKGHDAGVQICFEIIFPGLSAAMVRNGADILVNITNDAWFGRSSAPYQHFSMVKFRAVENRRSLARSANTGISGFIDPVGRVLSSTGLYTDEVLTGSLPVLEVRTFYTSYGDVFAIVCTLGVSCLALFTSGFKGKKKFNS